MLFIFVFLLMIKSSLFQILFNIHSKVIKITGLMKENKYVCVEDFRKIAKQKLAIGSFNYIESGSEEQRTKYRNMKSFENLVIIPRVLKDITEIDMSVEIFGKLCALPFGFTAWASNKLVDKEYGELIPSSVACHNKICYILSTWSNTHPKKIYEKNRQGNGQLVNPNFLQLYLSNNVKMNNKLIQLAQKARFDGIVITVDTQILGVRNKQMEEKPDETDLVFPIMEQIGAQLTQAGNQTDRQQYLKMRDTSLDWQKIKKIRQSTKLKLVLKGIMHPQDALIAAKYCDAIYISNHGGRQLDTVPATIQMLPTIVKALSQLPCNQKKPKIFIDGGIRTGTDIFKCLALGADYVFLGRPVAYALCEGEMGVQRLVDILRDELYRAMILSGTENIKAVNSRYIGFRPKF